MSPQKRRKPLDDTQGMDFVFGKSEQSEHSEKIEKPKESGKETMPSAPKQSTKPTESMTDIMNQLLEQPEKEPTVRITVDLPQSLHRKLSLFSARSGKKKAQIIRALLQPLLEQINE